MKKLIGLFLFAMFLGMVPTLATAETLDEAVKRKAQQAEIDRKKIPVFAISVEALQSGRELADMPTNVIEAARRIGGATTHVMVGKSEVTVEGKHGFVTFTIEPSAMSAPDARGATHHVWRPDPIEELIGWVHGVHTTGIVFAKGKDETSMAMPNFQTCIGITLDGRRTEDIYEACKRFGLGDVQNARMLKTDEDRASEREFLVYLVANYGVEGVLTREALTKALEGHMARVREIIKGSEEKTGYITYNLYSGAYMATTGHMLRADVHDMSSTIAPNGYVKLTVHVYSERVGSVQVELQYEDGTAVAQTEIGNMARAAFTRTDLVAPKGSVSGFEIVEIKLPPVLKPGKIQIVASAVDEQGDLIVHGEPIGTFEYATK